MIFKMLIRFIKQKNVNYFKDACICFLKRIRGHEKLFKYKFAKIEIYPDRKLLKIPNLTTIWLKKHQSKTSKLRAKEFKISLYFFFSNCLFETHFSIINYDVLYMHYKISLLDFISFLFLVYKHSLYLGVFFSQSYSDFFSNFQSH